MFLSQVNPGGMDKFSQNTMVALSVVRPLFTTLLCSHDMCNSSLPFPQVTYSLASGSLLLINKLAVTFFPAPSLVMVIQLTGTTVG